MTNKIVDLEYKENVKKQTQLVFEYQTMVNQLYGFVKVDIVKNTHQDLIIGCDHIYYVYVRQNKEDIIKYVSFPQTYEAVISFLLGLLYGVEGFEI